MTKQKNLLESQKEQKQRKNSTQVASEGQLNQFSYGGELFAQHNTSTHNQAALLRDPSLPTGLKQSYASQIGRTQGNQYLQRMLGSSNQSVVQRDSIQRTPQALPSGAPIFQMSVNAAEVIDTLKGMSASGDMLVGAMDWDSHDLSSQIRTVCGGNYFRGNNFWSSGWVDDGWPDYLSLGLTDVDVRVDLELMVDNIQPMQSGQGTFTSGGQATDTRTNSQQTGVTANGQGSIGGHEGAPGGQLNLGVSHQETQTQTMTSQGQSGLSMQMPATVSQGDLIMKVTFHYNPTLGSARQLGPQNVTVGRIVYGGPSMPAAPQ